VDTGKVKGDSVLNRSRGWTNVFRKPEKASKTGRTWSRKITKAERKATRGAPAIAARTNKATAGTGDAKSVTRPKITRRSKEIVVGTENRDKIGRKGAGLRIKAEKKTRVGGKDKAGRGAKGITGTGPGSLSKGSKNRRISKEAANQSTKRIRTRRESPKAGNRSIFRTRDSKVRSRSLFTHRAGDKSLHLRTQGEKSQHLRIENRKAFRKTEQGTLRRPKTPIREAIHRRWKDSSATRTYRERTSIVENPTRHEYAYVDYHDRVCHASIWPSYRLLLYYHWGPWYTYHHFYPWYHRKYVFVSLCGYWPVGYRYVRYYRYGWHPYSWYGYYPVAREIAGDTYNYYTYNYYYNDDTAGTGYGSASYDIQPVDHTTFADVRDRLARQEAAEPYEETWADKYFGQAVTAFEAGDYHKAGELFAKAMELAPDDVVLPFAYCQALFAAERYTEAAEALRTALSKISPEEENVFYPRGLYADDDVLFGQIEDLADKTELYSFDANLQLLLGYHLMGIGELDAAVEPLRLANQDLENASAAAVLLSLVEKLRLEESDVLVE
jgi:hypothetical protein